MRLLELISKYLRNVKFPRFGSMRPKPEKSRAVTLFTTSDADPIANERIGGPVVGKNTMRVESGVLEGEQ